MIDYAHINQERKEGRKKRKDTKRLLERGTNERERQGTE